MSALGTILTAMVTAFDAEGALDARESARLAKWLVDRGNDGLVVAGSTGEGMTLDAGERGALFAAVKEAVRGRASVIANIGTSDTRSTVRAAKEAEACGADAVLVVVPPYNKPTQGGMLEHFGAVAQATPLPVIVYNIPGRTGMNMQTQTLLELARRHKNIAGVKESSGDLMQIATVVRDREGDFRVWCGDDYLFLPCLAVGVDGVIGVASHVCSREYRAMYDAFHSGDDARATSIHLSLLELFNALFATSNPIPVKWVMAQMGFAVGRCRSPLDELPEGLARRLQPLIAGYLSSV